MTLDPSFTRPTRRSCTTTARPRSSRAHGPWVFRCGAHIGAQWVVVEARDAKHVGARLLAFPIDCATRSPDSYRVEPRANADTIDVERRLASLVNRERVAAKLAPLAGDRRAAAAARTQVR